MPWWRRCSGWLSSSPATVPDVPGTVTVTTANATTLTGSGARRRRSALDDVRACESGPMTSVMMCRCYGQSQHEAKHGVCSPVTGVLGEGMADEACP